MEDHIQTIIYIVIAIVLSLAGGLKNKRSRDKMKKEQLQKAREANVQTKPFEEKVNEKIDNFLNQEPPEIPVEKTQNVPVTNEAAEKKEVGLRNKKVRKESSIYKRIKTAEEEKDDPSFENHESIKDFDIKKAIVYKEILSPKFKEY